MKKEIKNTKILKKTVRPEKAKILKRVQDDMVRVQDEKSWFRCGFGALAPEKNFSPLTSHLSRKSAFTLAEVLITLGIIGVVAAMTMPSLIHKYQEKVRIQQYKKAMSLISQAVASQYAANGAYFECYYGNGYSNTWSQCDEMLNDIQKYLKVSKFCEKNAFNNGCIPDYDGMDTMLKDSDNNMSDEDIQNLVGIYCEGFSKNQIKNNPALVLADGTIIVPYLPGWALMLFLLDINGKKGPNKWGYDMFTAELRRSKGGLSLGPPSGCMEPAKGGLTSFQMYEKAFYGK